MYRRIGQRGERMGYRCAVSALMVATAAALVGCDVYERFKEGARVSPIIGRSAADTEGAGGYAIDKPKQTAQANQGASGTGSGANNPKQDVKDLRHANPRPVDLDTFRFPSEDSGKTAYEEAVGNAEMRNRLQSYLLRISDEVCQVHKSDILAVSATINVSLSGITSVLGGVGAIVTGADAARALAGTAGISNAFRENLNQNVFYNNVAPAILRQIDAQRQKKLQEIAPQQALDTHHYSVDAAITDVDQYHNLCSFSEGIAALATDAKRPANADELRARLDTLRSEYDKNVKLINAKPAPTDAVKKSLESTNAGIARMIQALTIQLGLVQNAPAGQAPEGSASPASPSPDNNPLPDPKSKPVPNSTPAPAPSTPKGSTNPP